MNHSLSFPFALFSLFFSLWSGLTLVNYTPSLSPLATRLRLREYLTGCDCTRNVGVAELGGAHIAFALAVVPVFARSGSPVLAVPLSVI